MARKPLDIDDIPLPTDDDARTDPAPVTPRAPRRRASTTRATATGTGRGRIGVRSKNGQIMSRAAMIDKVRAEVHTYLGLGVGAWAMRDPCAEMMFENIEFGGRRGERLDFVVDRVVAIISRYESVLSFMASSGVLGDAATLGFILMPVVKAAWQAHGPAGSGHESEGDGADTFGQFPAYTG